MRVLGLLLVTGCSFRSGGAAVVDANPSGDDAPITQTTDAGPDAQTQFCFGTQTIDMVCLSAKPTGSMSKSGTFDTGKDNACIDATINGVDACVLASDTFTVTGPWFVTGTKPLVIIGVTSIQVNVLGVLDVGAHTSSGAGARSAASAVCTANGTAAVLGGGGWGAPGSDQGGDGGAELDDQNNVAGAGATAPDVIAMPTALAGGCPGGPTKADANAGGLGGGVVALISAAVNIDGVVSVSGGGGKGGQHHSNDGHGGGGGGGAGLLIIDSPAITGGGSLFAQGGGGGEGGDQNDNGDGHAGIDGLALVNSGKGGDNGTIDGGHGGDGATGTTTAGTDGFGGSHNAGGGGGGGSSGFNVTFGGTPAASLSFSPAHH